VHPEETTPDEKSADTTQPANAAGKRAKGAGAGLVGLGLLLAKFKGLLALLLNLKYAFLFTKFFALSWTFLLSLWLYVLFFGWRFAVVLILVLLVHELGHYAAFRAYGLPAHLPQFVPFLGAFTAGAPPEDLEHDANIALAGPLTGLGLAGVCYAIGIGLHDPFWLAIANVSAFLNLFNMIPMPPFDGGRVIGAISPLIWILGFGLFVGLAVYLGVPVLFVLLIGLLGLPAIISAWRGNVDPRAANMTPSAKLRVSASYLGTLAGLILLLAVSHVNIQTGQSGPF
jgi:Zn-dependent protease